ncbi:MAG: SRPBCC family protein [Dehalococcoidia bacterium]
MARFLREPLRVSAAIAAPIESVWEVLADLPAQPKWMTDALEVRVTSGQPYGLGTRAVVPTRIAGITVTDEIEVTRWEPPHHLGIRHVGRLFSGDALISVEPAGAGSLVTWEEDLQPPLGMLGRAGFWFGRPVLRRQFAGDLARLKNLVESRPG